MEKYCLCVLGVINIAKVILMTVHFLVFSAVRAHAQQFQPFRYDVSERSPVPKQIAFFLILQAPKSMKTVTMAAWYFSVACGNLLVIIITQAQFFSNQVHNWLLSHFPGCHSQRSKTPTFCTLARRTNFSSLLLSFSSTCLYLLGCHRIIRQSQSNLTILL